MPLFRISSHPELMVADTAEKAWHESHHRSTASTEGILILHFRTTVSSKAARIRGSGPKEEGISRLVIEALLSIVD